MALLTLAILIDLVVGDPRWLWQRVPHPVVLFGQVISFLEARRSRWQMDGWGDSLGYAPGFLAGIAVLVALAGVSLLVTWLVVAIGNVWSIAGFIAELMLVAVLIAQKSLYDHVKAVADALRLDGLEAGRRAVSMIVGRNVSALDESGVSKAAIESLAENFSDGVVAPVFWYAVLGLPGILFYKAVNTADSMIGHRTEQYEYFGKAAARLDDWMNWPAARGASVIVWIAVAMAKGMRAAGKVWEVTVRDAPGHRSPNAGWPEASVAAALGLALGGPRSYGAEKVDAVTLYPEGRSDAGVADIEKALALLLRCCFCLAGLSGLLWLIFS